MDFKAPPGVNDILPEDTRDPWKSSYLWNWMEANLRSLAERYGFQEIRTPLFEKTELFTRSVGETSDIVTKEMYTFEDRGGRSLTLRPEGTAPVIRAFLENQLFQQSALHRLYYICPMFRYERSQAGRYRQHHQFGVEVFGSDAPETDAEVIDLGYSLSTLFGIKNLTVAINSIGDQACRESYKKALKSYLTAHLNKLSKDSQTRFEKNPLRILDSKAPEDQEVIEQAPNILEFLDKDTKSHFEAILSYLKDLNIPFEVNHRLVRGLDYYNKTVFEIVSGNLGAQNSILGGGRYDGLVKELGGPDTPSIGFGCGLERLLQTILNQKAPLPLPPSITLFMIPLGDAAKKVCFTLQKALRQAHISVQTDFSGRKLGKVMGLASQLGAIYVAVIGDDELKSGKITLKEMTTGNKYETSIENLGRILQVETQSEAFIDLWKEMDHPFQTALEAEFFKKKIHKSIQDTAALTKHLRNALIQMQTALENGSSYV